MKHNDLENDNIPTEQRIKHLEREAGFVRDYVTNNDRIVWVLILTCAMNLALTILSLAK